MIEVSLIIPTHNRADSLKSTIASALDLDYPADRFEIIIVDNASNDETATLIESYQKKNNGKKLRCIQEAQLGLHYARHAGVRAAAGELLLFTDDDASFDSGLLKAYVNAFTKNLAMVAAGGPVRPIWNQPPPPWLLEYIGDSKQFSILSLMEPFEEFRLAEDCYFFGVNMAIRKNIFNRTGFHPELIGAKTIGDGETGLLQDIRKFGGLIGYVPEAIVFHHIPPRRMTVNYIRKWAWHQGGAQMYQRWWNRKIRPASLGREVLILTRLYWRAWLKDFFIRQRRDPEAINIQFQASLGWCKLNYIWWLLTSSKVRGILDKTDFRPCQ